MAPEVVSGDRQTARRYLALGLMLYEMLAGSHPFFDGSINTLMANILTVPRRISNWRGPMSPKRWPI